MQDKPRVIEHIRQAFTKPRVPVTPFCTEATKFVNRVNRSRRSSRSPIARNWTLRCSTPATTHSVSFPKGALSIFSSCPSDRRPRRPAADRRAAVPPHERLFRQGREHSRWATDL
jgi:hypothetical protein